MAWQLPPHLFSVYNLFMEQHQIIDRRGSGSLKWDVAAKDELPLWVADMDFSSPQVVLEAIRQRLDHPILGYTRTDNQCLHHFADWCEARQGWRPEISDLVMTGGILSAIGMALQFFTKPGDGVVIQTPVYHPFATIVSEMDRKLIRNSLIRQEGTGGNPYRMDFDKLRDILESEKPKALVLCSPHNPVGRVWKREELETLLELCARNQVFVISDEIHADIIMPGHKFISVGEMIGPGKRFPNAAALVLQSPSKTFNIPGLPSCLAYVPGSEWRQKLRDGISALGMSTINVLAQVACSAAYAEGAEWMDEVLGVIDTNYRLLEMQVRQWRDRWPAWATTEQSLQLITPEGSYLAWLRFKPIQEALKIDNAGLQQWLRKNAGVYLSAGQQFGSEGDGYLRLNVATHEAILIEALERLQKALDGIYEARS